MLNYQRVILSDLSDCVPAFYGNNTGNSMKVVAACETLRVGGFWWFQLGIRHGLSLARPDFGPSLNADQFQLRCTCHQERHLKTCARVHCNLVGLPIPTRRLISLRQLKTCFSFLGNWPSVHYWTIGITGRCRAPKSKFQLGAQADYVEGYMFVHNGTQVGST